MFLVDFAAEHNLLTIRFTGTVGADEMRACYERGQAVLADVQPGYRLLSDLSELDTMDPACVPSIRQSMQFCNSKGIARIVRVIPDARKDIGFNLLAVFHYDPSVRISVCETRAQAEELLGIGRGD